MTCCGDSLLSGLMGQLGLAPHTVFRLGFWSDAGLYVDQITERSLLEKMVRCLYDTGRFTTVNIQRLAGQLNPYYQVYGQTNIGFARPDDLVNLIINTIRFHCPTTFDVDSTDQLVIDEIPEPYRGDPNVQQPAPGPSDVVPTTPTTPAPPSGPGLFDQIAAALEVPKSTAQALVFGGVALALILILKR